jgi:hypothetical protein
VRRFGCGCGWCGTCRHVVESLRPPTASASDHGCGRTRRHLTTTAPLAFFSAKPSWRGRLATLPPTSGRFCAACLGRNYRKAIVTVGTLSLFGLGLFRRRLHTFFCQNHEAPLPFVTLELRFGRIVRTAALPSVNGVRVGPGCDKYLQRFALPRPCCVNQGRSSFVRLGFRIGASLEQDSNRLPTG